MTKRNFLMAFAMIFSCLIVPSIARSGETDLAVDFFGAYKTGETLEGVLPLTLCMMASEDADSCLEEETLDADFTAGLAHLSLSLADLPEASPSELWLQVTIETPLGTEILPAIELHAVPWAKWADNCGVASSVTNNSLTSVSYSSSSVGASALDSTGVTAGTYGSATLVPQFTVDSDGRITAASNIAIPASAGDISGVTAGAGLAGGGASGDVTLTAVLGTTVDNTEIVDGTIGAADLDLSMAPTWTGVHTFNTDVNMTFGGTENLAITSDLSAATVTPLSVVVTPSTTAGTKTGILVQQALNGAGSDTLTHGLKIENLDDDGVTNAITTVGGGGGFVKILETDTLDIAGDGSLTTPSFIRTGADGFDGSLRIFSDETVAGIDQTVIFVPHANMTQDVTYTLPADDGIANQVLQSDGAGALTWATVDTSTTNEAPVGAEYIVSAGHADLTAEDVLTCPGTSGLSCTNAVGSMTLSVNTGSGIQIVANGVALGPLTGDWSQTGAFDIVLDNSASELQIQESTGTFNAILDVGDLTADQTYTFSGAAGTVFTTGNDGAGSGLDADTLDAFDSAAFPRKVEAATITGSWIFSADPKVNKADPSAIFEVTGGDTDFWIGVQDNADAADNDTFQIGTGTAPGVSSKVTITTAGSVGIGGTPDSGLDLTQNQNSATTLRVDNSDAGATAARQILLDFTGVEYASIIARSAAHATDPDTLQIVMNQGAGSKMAFITAGGQAMTIDDAQRVGIGDATPTQMLTVGTADQFLVTSAGAVTGASLNLGTTTILDHLSGTTTNLISASIATVSCGNYGTITVTGAAVGDTVYASPDAASSATGIEDVNLMWNAVVTAVDTVTIRACNPTAGAIDAADDQEWRADVWKH